jgi:hypothetical protein
LYELLIQIALDEDDVEEIMWIVEDRPSSAVSRIIAVVEAVEETEPEAALHFYVSYISYLIDNRNRSAHERATHSWYVYVHSTKNSVSLNTGHAMLRHYVRIIRI